MALRAAALIAVGSVAHASAASVCPDSTNPMISAVTDLSPECFKQCPQMCQPLDGLVTEYMATADTNSIKAKVCADQAPFTCMFEGDHLDSCGKVLSAGSAMGVTLPMSVAELQQQCGSNSLRGGGAKHQDVKDESDDSNSTNTTNSSSNNTLAADIGAASGRGGMGTTMAQLLGLLGPVVLLFTA
mmetsp:Transcript_114891/g.287087  ORF Transcript_114891/g.287087 Transcript_114891/m.287087 type:complete len:186 (+) Transcript_114891:77-634(+)